MKTSKEPLITIAIPTYKRAEFLKLAIESAINQVQTDNIEYEIIVVDNEAGDQINETQIITDAYKKDGVLYHKNDVNLGMIGNFNQCIKLAKGKWIAFLHDDDILDEIYINRIYSYINKYKNVQCFIPNYREINSDGVEIVGNKKNRRNKKLIMKLFRTRAWKVHDRDDIIMNFNFYGPPSCGMIVEKACALKINGFQAKSPLTVDWEFFTDLKKQFTIYKLNEILASYRWAVNASLTFRENNLKEMHKEKERMLQIIYSNRSGGKIYDRFVKMNMKMNDWEWCRKYPQIKKYVKYKSFSCIDIVQFYIWALMRRVYMYFRDAFVVKAEK